MNYVAFEGITYMDNLYAETVRKMKIQEINEHEAV